MRLQDICDRNIVLTQEELSNDTELIKEAQTRLAQLGYYPAKRVDGLWGRLTEGAIISFCLEHHLNNHESKKYGATWAKALLESKVGKSTVSSQGIDLIAEFEGCRLTAYRCPANVPTIGYGHTHGVKMGDRLNSIAEAKELLLNDLNREYLPGVLAAVKVTLTQNQLDALVSLCYNIGVGAIARSTLVRKVNEGDINGAANEFLKWNKAGSHILPGLTRRRTAERQLFLSHAK